MPDAAKTFVHPNLVGPAVVNSENSSVASDLVGVDLYSAPIIYLTFEATVYILGFGGG